MPGNYRYEEERNRGQRSMTRRGEFGGRGRDEDEWQEQQTERFGRGPDYERDRGDRSWGSGRRQYGYDEGFSRGMGGRSGRSSYEGYDDENSGSGGQYGRGFGQEYGQGRGYNEDYEQGSYGDGGMYGQGRVGQGGNYGGYNQTGGYGSQGGYGQGGYGQGAYGQSGGSGQGGYGQSGYGRGQGGYGQGSYYSQGGQPRSQYGQSGYGRGQGTGGWRDEGSRYGSGMSQGDGFNEPDEMRWGRQQGLYGGSEYAGHISSQRSQSEYQSHIGKGPKGWQRSDERVREEVNEALARHPEIDASDIEVKVQGGEVTLSGTVTDRRWKRLAEDVAERVFGANEVQNQIRVKQEGSGRDKSSEREVSRTSERESGTTGSSSQKSTAGSTNAGATTR